MGTVFKTESPHGLILKMEVHQDAVLLIAAKCIAPFKVDCSFLTTGNLMEQCQLASEALAHKGSGINTHALLFSD